MSPRRAAKAASANIAKQLDSSDSDDEEHYGARVPTEKNRRLSSASSRCRAKAHIATAAGSSPRTPRPLSTKGVTPRPRKRPLAPSGSDVEDLTREPLAQPFPVFEESPARKKQKLPLTDTEDHHSRPLSVRNAEDVDEELPDPTSAFSRMNYSVRATCSTEGTTPETLLEGSLDTEDAYEEQFWEPPEADPCIKIPGEPILAQTKKGDVYWPAMVLDYIPPRERNEKEGKYRVLFLDNAERCIHRARFYIAEDDEFGTCKLGQFTSQFNEVEADEDFVASPIQQTGHRPSSPVPTDPPPSSSEFYELSVHEQLSYTKPILQAILMGTYTPAAERHNGFIAGGNARDIVVQNAAMRGDMDPRDVSELQNRLMEWCLRDERYARRMEGDAVVLTEPPIKPRSHQDAPALAQEGLPPNPKMTIAVDREVSPAMTLASTPPTEPPSSQLSVVSTIETVHIEDPRKSLLDVVAHTDPPRQRGCPQYEALSAREKIEYCLNVLLPESIIQIFLWKSGDRKCISLRSPEEEAALHTVGEEMRAKRDWVFDVMRLRDMHEHRRGVKRKRPVPEKDAVVEGTGTRTRLRTRKSIP
ncbi:hypothetical protein PC9H_000614 [Pleurotus ostreatus]|uniref:PWWP domain-containing protein n=1 Tax=Pleurotus ostreatus TaxID=5322 RepID=A0A8H7DWZ8_PLEOS|nr:uncharacterized protein PC9H_000614 [Pleurotus ostreatus]KAF7440270.1 hypothetical protein PC9H_000614 [Pleurotus ostreatus]